MAVVINDDNSFWWRSPQRDALMARSHSDLFCYIWRGRCSLSVWVYVCLSIRLSICLYLYMSICLSICPSVCQCACLFVHLSVCLSISLRFPVEQWLCRWTGDWVVAGSNPCLLHHWECLVECPFVCLFSVELWLGCWTWDSEVAGSNPAYLTINYDFQ